MSFSPQILEEKPYNLCLNCAYIGKRCDGPNFLAMDTERLCEWCRLRKEYLGWTNAYIADKAKLSRVSVERIMSGNVKDLRISTLQAVLRVLVNGTWGQYPCAMAGMAESETVYMENPELVKKAEESAAECARLRAVLEKLTDEHKADVSAVHAADQRKIDYLKEQTKVKDEQMRQMDKLLEERYEFLKRKDRANTILAILLFISLAVIFTALVVDRLNPDVGFFWRAAYDVGRSSMWPSEWLL